MMASQENVEDPKNKSKVVAQTDSVLRSHKNPPTFAMEDFEEEKILRSRIEEQSNLISLLKHRAEETLHRYLAMQNINSELEVQVAHLQRELASKTEHAEALKIRCIDLAADKDAMELQKRHNVQLTTENQQLRKDLAACELKLQEQAAQHKSREDSLLGQLCDAQQRHTDAVEMCEDFKQKLEVVEITENIKKEKNKFLKKKKNKTLQEKEEEILQLEVKWKEEKKARIEAQKRFEMEAEAVNTDSRVKSLESALEECKAKLKKLTMDFKAFTEHTTNLLERERNLNKRLQDMIRQI
ncbi:coiled-coil domain-containing protein 89 isoform X2 [Oryzias melastigma]|uniref:coiled-coil domain-containing protein 89 isoform X2 n=1 Tax=Oryzias melastigma TaxID=30732 RepID=UPI000CF80883|nr:coiled-coil domain-containing protein 89 isoform X2 [Oryzias melastigma]